METVSETHFSLEISNIKMVSDREHSSHDKLFLFKIIPCVILYEQNFNFKNIVNLRQFLLLNFTHTFQGISFTKSQNFKAIWQ